MHFLGKYVSAGRTLDGDITLTFSTGEIDANELKELAGDLAIDIEKYSPKRGINANRYFWKLCDLMAKKLGSDKDTVYLLQLNKYGVFIDVEIVPAALEELRSKFRYVEVLADNYSAERITARCYFGSSSYTKKEMADLINGTVEDAKDLNISVWSEVEIDNLINNWRGA